MNRRNFLRFALSAAVAAPLIAAPTLEEIERLTYRRRYWPGVGYGNRMLTTQEITRVILEELQRNFTYTRYLKRDFEADFTGERGFGRLSAPYHRAGVGFGPPGTPIRYVEALAMGYRLAETLHARGVRELVQPPPVQHHVDECCFAGPVRGIADYSIVSNARMQRFDVEFVSATPVPSLHAPLIGQRPASPRVTIRPASSLPGQLRDDQQSKPESRPSARLASRIARALRPAGSEPADDR